MENWADINSGSILRQVGLISLIEGIRGVGNTWY